tara:strand:+ start:1404 stop:3776 length:2373 start_codon:yes stop_codon:yes gene_type:complete
MKKMKRFIPILMLLVLTACFTTPRPVGAVQVLFNPKFMTPDDDWDPMAGCIYTYEAGTTSDKTTYSDSALTVANSNPIQATSRAEVGPIYFEGLIKIVLANPDGDGNCPATPGTTEWTVDNYEGAGSSILDFTMLSDYTSLANAVSTIGATETTLVIDADDTMAGNVTIPATLSLLWLRSNVITTSGNNLVIDGTVDAPPYQIFSDAGTVSFNGDMTLFGYAEWWGIDGTDDNVQIDLSLASGLRKVQLLGNTTYDIDSVDLQSNTWLCGMGEDTVLLMNTESASPATSGVYALNETNFRISDLTVDGDESGSLGAMHSSGIMFSSCQYGSIERVHVTDVHGAGIAINAVASGTTEQIRVNDCRISDISKWNSSIGSGRGITFWAFISSDTNNNNIVQHCFVDNLVIQDTGGPGIGNDTGHGGTALLAPAYTGRTVDNIHYSNITVKDATDFAFAMADDATNITVTNFRFDTITRAGSPSEGFHIEGCDGFTISNGTIENVDTGIFFSARVSDTDLAESGTVSNVKIDVSGGVAPQYGINFYGVDAASSNDDIVIDGCVLKGGKHGVHLEAAQDVILSNLIISDAVATGGAHNGWAIRSGDTASATIDNVSIIGCHTNNNATGSFSISHGTDWKIKNNICDDTAPTVANAISNDDINAEMAAYYFGDLVNTAEPESVIFITPGPNGAYILDCLWTVDADFAADAVNFSELIFQSRTAAGVYEGDVCFYDLDNLAVLKWVTMSTKDDAAGTLSSTYQPMTVGELGAFNKNRSGGNGTTTDGLNLVIKYITY